MKENALRDFWETYKSVYFYFEFTIFILYLVLVN